MESVRLREVDVPAHPHPHARDDPRRVAGGGGAARRDRLRQPGGALSCGQQQRLCIARSRPHLGPLRALATADTPGHIVEEGVTRQVFDAPSDPRTAEYVHGRFG